MREILRTEFGDLASVYTDNEETLKERIMQAFDQAWEQVKEISSEISELTMAMLNLRMI